jgi:hypothetical protein
VFGVQRPLLLQLDKVTPLRIERSCASQLRPDNRHEGRPVNSGDVHRAHCQPSGKLQAFAIGLGSSKIAVRVDRHYPPRAPRRKEPRPPSGGLLLYRRIFSEAKWPLHGDRFVFDRQAQQDAASSQERGVSVRRLNGRSAFSRDGQHASELRADKGTA